MANEEDKIASLSGYERVLKTSGQQESAQQSHSAYMQRRATAQQWLRRRQDGLDWLLRRENNENRLTAIKKALDGNFGMAAD